MKDRDVLGEFVRRRGVQGNFWFQSVWTVADVQGLERALGRSLAESWRELLTTFGFAAFEVRGARYADLSVPRQGGEILYRINPDDYNEVAEFDVRFSAPDRHTKTDPWMPYGREIHEGNWFVIGSSIGGDALIVPTFEAGDAQRDSACAWFDHEGWSISYLWPNRDAFLGHMLEIDDAMAPEAKAKRGK